MFPPDDFQALVRRLRPDTARKTKHGAFKKRQKLTNYIGSGFCSFLKDKRLSYDSCSARRHFVSIESCLNGNSTISFFYINNMGYGLCLLLKTNGDYIVVYLMSSPVSCLNEKSYHIFIFLLRSLILRMVYTLH